MKEDTIVREYKTADWREVWRIQEPTFREGESYMIDPEITVEEAKRIWTEHSGCIYVAEDSKDRIIGSYYLKANQSGPGNHFCNASFVVLPEVRGRGIARIMGCHAVEEARRKGFEAMQFNTVMSTNTPAVKL